MSVRWIQSSNEDFPILKEEQNLIDLANNEFIEI